MICIAEPSGTGEILGAELFRNFTVKYLNKILESLSEFKDIIKIVHICGKLKSVYNELKLRCVQHGLGCRFKIIA